MWIDEVRCVVKATIGHHDGRDTVPGHRIRPRIQQVVVDKIPIYWYIRVKYLFFEHRFCKFFHSVQMIFPHVQSASASIVAFRR